MYIGANSSSWDCLLIEIMNKWVDNYKVQPQIWSSLVLTTIIIVKTQISLSWRLNWLIH